MTEQLRQSLSAVVDGEADAFELRRVVDELDRDPELRAAWDRYHLIGSVIRRERTVASRSAARVLSSRVPLAVRESSPAANGPTGDLVDSVTGRLQGRGAQDAADTVDGGTQRAASRRRLLVGGTLAASVMLAAAIVLQPFDGQPGSPDLRLVEATDVAPIVAAPLVSAPPVAAPLVAAAGPATETVIQTHTEDTRQEAGQAIRAATLADRQRARAYMLQHAQHQGLEQRGVISLVKMATYEAP